MQRSGYYVLKHTHTGNWNERARTVNLSENNPWTVAAPKYLIHGVTKVLGRQSCCWCNTEWERSCQQRPHAMSGESYFLPRRSLKGEVQPELLPPSAPHPFAILLLSSLPKNPYPTLAKCEHAATSLLSSPCPTQALPPCFLSVTPWWPLHSSLSSMPLIEKQMDLLTF